MRSAPDFLWIGRALTILATYAIWVLAFRLLILTFITYFLTSSPGHSTHFEDITEAIASNEVSLMGLSALAYVLLMRALNPLTSTTTDEIFTPERLEKQFLPGFINGAVLAFGVVLAFLLTGLYRYLGFFIQVDEAPWALAGVALRIASLFSLAYFEEFIFRHKVTRQFKSDLPNLARDLAGCVIIAIFYCAIKTIQFDLGIMHLTTLFLLSLTLSLRSLVNKDFIFGAGFWAALLIVFNPLLSLPIFGSDFSGLLLVKYQTLTEAAAVTPSATTRFLTGGVGGPAASFAFQLLLTLDVVRGILRYVKIVGNHNRRRPTSPRPLATS